MSQADVPVLEEAPLPRSGRFSLDHLREHARALAGDLKLVPSPSQTIDLFQRIKSCERDIQTTYRWLTSASQRDATVTRDAEWLLDNFYVVEEHFHEVEEDLPPKYFAELPKLENGEPRVYRLARELILHTDGLLDESTIVGFVRAFQDVAPLTIGEVWAVPIMLRVALIEHLGGLARCMHQNLAHRDTVRDLLATWSDRQSLPDPLRTGGEKGLLAQALIYLEDCPAEDADRLLPMERLLADCHPALHDDVRTYHQQQAANQVSIGNVITAMRLISALDWVEFFEGCSLVEQLLRTDPARAYAEMDYESRDRYRHAVEGLAKRSKATEIETATAAIRHSARVDVADAAMARRRHVGYWLVDEGRRTLEVELRYRPTIRETIARALRSCGLMYYGGSILAVTAVAVAAILGLSIGWSSWVSVVLAVPLALAISEFSVGMVNFLTNRLVPPRVLPKLEFRDGVSTDNRTIVVVPSMLTSLDEVAELLRRLELHYVANADPQLSFALLTDFADASEQSQPKDSELIDAARGGIATLNQRYGDSGAGPFYLFHRQRVWNPSENCWMGWERKRGKLMEFHRLLRDESTTSYIVQEGDLDRLTGPDAARIRFVITCDADTQLPHGAARRLIGALAHPLNRACFKGTSSQVVAGYSLIQPRVSVSLAEGQKSWFVQIMANSRGIDPYATAASDVYQDLFGEGSFTGKGIYDLDAFERGLHDAFDENRILSHDLIEGCHLRTALASDIEVMDGYPSRYDADARRQHRWVRGDWQISPWLFPRTPSSHGPRRSQLSWLSWWKIADNLRRSLVPPAIVMMMVLGWYLAPTFAWLWSLVALICVGTAACIAMIASLEGLTRARDFATGIRTAADSLRTAVLQTIVLAVSLPHRAANMVDAISRTLWRMFVTRRHMLEWQTAAATDRLLSNRKASSWPQLLTISGLALAMGFTLPWTATAAAAPWLVAWLCSPLFLELISRPRRIHKVKLDDETRLWLRLIARKNWNYFEQTLGPENNWLPPDNVQEYPGLRVANRLSPTNEGLFLVSVLAARDFGYLSLHAMLDFWERNLQSLSQLPRVGGHFFNWYDTTTMQPLRPRYLSTVDSGNLAASLMVVQQGIHELREGPISREEAWQGLADTIAVAQAMAAPSKKDSVADQGHGELSRILRELQQECGNPPRELMELPRAMSVLRNFRQRLLPTSEGNAFQGNGHFLEEESGELKSLRSWLDGQLREYNQLFAWVELLTRNHPTDTARTQTFNGGDWRDSSSCRDAWEALTAKAKTIQTLSDLANLEDRFSESIASLHTALAAAGIDTSVREQGRQWIDAFVNNMRTCSQHAKEIDSRLLDVARCARQLVDEMNFRFLYDPLRRLFSIGYNLDEGQLDGSHYDLLCSEARLTSYLAVARGDVPVRHWFRLGRQTTYAAGQVGVLSWGGTMFEFLMPLLFQPRIEGSLLAAACEAAVGQQQSFARQRGVPWGVSESAYASFSPNSDYQYQSFGVPGLGLKRGLSKDNVVAPYATMLALEICPAAAVRNLRRLEKEGMLARWGFYEAIDFTPSRVPAGKQAAIVRCFMAHHQGMSFLSLSNLLNGESIRRRFRSSPLMKAAELLLQEGVPVSSQVVQPHADETADTQVARPAEQPVVSRRIATYDTIAPRTHLMSNGSYSVMLTNAGSGYSRWKDISISRWRSDTTRDHWGQWLYLSDPRNGDVWSVGYQPTLVTPDEYEVVFSIDKAEIHRRDGEIESSLEVAVSPEDAIEIRQLKLTNLGRKPRVLDVTSYAEVVLTKAAADLSHPAFQKLFVETEYVPELHAVLARRRPRDADEPVLWAVHVLSLGDSGAEQVQWETSRAEFLGRGRTARNPLALDPGKQLSGTTGAVLDPVFAIRCRVTVPAEGTCHLAIMTGFASSREEALSLADTYHDWRSAQRALELAWAFNQMELRHWRANAAQTHRYQQLASSILYPNGVSRGRATAMLGNRSGQSELWPFGVSGDLPIVLVRVNQSRQLNFVRELLVAQEFWAFGQFHVDLVILNCLPGSYIDELQEQLERLIRETPRRVEVRPGKAFVLRCSQLSTEQMQLFEAVAAVVLEAARGWSNAALLPQSRPTNVPTTPLVPLPRRHFLKKLPIRPSSATESIRDAIEREKAELELWNGYGGFADDGREYHILTSAERPTPMPWSNVIANERFGCLVTESGGGYTWAENSRENKLTTWCNDPITDAPSEQFYLRDGASDEVWPLFGGAPKSTATRSVRHGCGWSRWAWSIPGLSANITISIAANDPVKFLEVQLQNETTTPREVFLSYFAELVLGVCREETQMQLVTEILPETQTLLARNGYHPEFPDQVVFLRAIGGEAFATGDRTSFLGRNGNVDQPTGAKSSVTNGCAGAGLDPCGAVQSRISLGSMQTASITIVLGRGANRQEAEMLLERYSRETAILQAHEAARDRWEDVLNAVQIETPNRTFDLLTNRWSLYQVLSCRLWGRSAFYQSGGAYGFRDQLQDVMALVYARPDLVRDQILRAAARQYLEGDVQHWWHVPSGRGTRTRFSDDLLWMIYATCHYVEITGDGSIWEEQATFLESPELSPDEQERYELPTVSHISGSIYEHCLRALHRGYRLGEHGLPLMGCGDWNDGMNKVGAGGRGESVWVGWFLAVILDRFLPTMEQRGDRELANDYRQKRAELLRQLEHHGWDGKWYRRAFFDDGTPLGSQTNSECRIDSLSQSWAVLAGADDERTTMALEAVGKHLVRFKDHLVALLDPPFDKSEPNPGYIAGYVKGVRENGGQYTHAVLWLIQALTEKGDGNQAMAIFDLINPIRQTATEKDVARYKVEPYVLAADVYSQPPHQGRGGWTWYTGSAAWTYRVALENILGLRLRGREVSFRPCVPADWSHFCVTLRVGRSTWRLRVELFDSDSEGEKDCNSHAETDPIQLVDDGEEHDITLTCHRGSPASYDIGDRRLPNSLALRDAQR
jgi:cyclic beta-1,2-glucan synthetase